MAFLEAYWFIFEEYPFLFLEKVCINASFISTYAVREIWSVLQLCIMPRYYRALLLINQKMVYSKCAIRLKNSVPRLLTNITINYYKYSDRAWQKILHHVGSFIVFNIALYPNVLLKIWFQELVCNPSISRKLKHTFTEMSVAWLQPPPEACGQKSVQ